MKKQNYRPIALGDTATLVQVNENGEILVDSKGKPKFDEKAWLEWRKHGPLGNIPYTIGGSEVACTMDLSPWVTSLELYNSKKGIKPITKKEFNEEAKEAGHIFEPYIIDMFCNIMVKKGHKVHYFNDTNMYQCGRVKVNANNEPLIDSYGKPILQYPFAVANLDGRVKVDGKMCILEIKTTSNSWHNKNVIEDWKNGIVPIYYELQCRHYMAVTNLDTAYICCMWGFKASECAIIKIERDLDWEEELLRSEQEFVQKLETNQAPSSESTNAMLLLDYYSRLYGETSSNLPVVTLGSEYAITMKTIASIQNNIDALKEKQKAYEDVLAQQLIKIAPLFEHSQKGVYEDSSMKVFVDVKAGKKRSCAIDEEALKRDNPSLYEECKVFSPSVLKDKDKAEYNKYVKPQELTGSRSYKITVREKEEL